MACLSDAACAQWCDHIDSSQPKPATLAITLWSRGPPNESWQRSLTWALTLGPKTRSTPVTRVTVPLNFHFGLRLLPFTAPSRARIYSVMLLIVACFACQVDAHGDHSSLRPALGCTPKSFPRNVSDRLSHASMLQMPQEAFEEDSPARSVCSLPGLGLHPRARLQRRGRSFSTGLLHSRDIVKQGCTISQVATAAALMLTAVGIPVTLRIGVEHVLCEVEITLSEPSPRKRCRAKRLTCCSRGYISRTPAAMIELRRWQQHQFANHISTHQFRQSQLVLEVFRS